MKEQLVNFETAKLAKEKGFEEFVSYCYLEDGELYGTYSLMNEDDSAFIDIMDGNELENHNSSNFDRYSAPTQSLLQKWLREKYKTDIIIIVNYNQHKQIKTYRCGIVYIKQLSDRQLIETFFIRPEGEKFLFIEFSTYEEALEKGLQEALKLI